MCIRDRIPEAIGFQRTVVAFTERAKKLDPQAIVQTKLDLSKLFIKQNDYSSAEPYLQQSVVIAQKETAIPRAQRTTTLKTYSTVLRKLKKTTEAEAIEAALAAQALEDEAMASKKDEAQNDTKPEAETKTEQKPEEKTSLKDDKPAEKSGPAAETKASAEIK